MEVCLHVDLVLVPRQRVSFPHLSSSTSPDLLDRSTSSRNGSCTSSPSPAATSRSRLDDRCLPPAPISILNTYPRSLPASLPVAPTLLLALLADTIRYRPNPALTFRTRFGQQHRRREKSLHAKPEPVAGAAIFEKSTKKSDALNARGYDSPTKRGRLREKRRDTWRLREEGYK